MSEPANCVIADAHLIDGQYADRPHLRPILDAVLAALPGLGPVTVQARGTLVSLISSRRTFAVVMPTTKNRVDLGFRLANAEPGGRLRPARDVGQATVRVPLSTPDEVDDEAIGWLRRAYEESIAPPPPRRPAKRPAPVLGSMTVLIEGSELPGLTCHPDRDLNTHRNVHVALYGRGQDRPALVMPGRPMLAVEPVAGDAQVCSSPRSSSPMPRATRSVPGSDPRTSPGPPCPPSRLAPAKPARNRDPRAATGSATRGTRAR